MALIRWLRLCFALLTAATALVACHEVIGDYETQPPGEALARLCRPGSFRCNAEYLLRCNADGMTWSLDTTCPTASQCDARGGRCTVCEDGDLRCNEENREACADDRGGWQVLETCESMALCNDTFCGSCPSPGELRCAGASGTQLEQCGRDGTWAPLDECASEALCKKTVDLARQEPKGFAGRCEAPVCEHPGEYSCDGMSLRRCAASRDGSTTVGTCASTALCQLRAEQANATLESGAVVDRCEAECPAGQLRCSGERLEVLERCTDDSTSWSVLETCPEQTQCDPVAGKCAGPCQPGEYRCNGPGLEQCDERETWQPVETCLSAGLCRAEHDRDSGTWAGRCDPPAEGCVAPDQHRCNVDDPTRLERCTDDMTRWELVDTCRSAALCDADSKRCDAPPDGCTDELGTRLLRCDPAAPQRVERCNADLTGWEPHAECAEGELCFPSDLETPCHTECPSALSCNGAELRRCSPEQGIVHQASCSTAALCACATNGTCPAGIADDGCGLAVCGGPAGPQHQCAGTVLQACSEGRDAWLDQSDCGSDAGASLCFPGLPPLHEDAFCAACPLAREDRCDGGTLRTCVPDRSMWSTQSCTYGCVDSGTNDYCALCFEDETRCAGGQAGMATLRQCTDDRSELVTVASCALGCFDSGPSDFCRACAVGESRCTSSTQRASCTETPAPPALGPPETCPQTCIQSGNADYCGSCTPGQTQCSGNGLQTCSAAGSFGTPEPCPNGCIDSGSADFCSPECNPSTEPWACDGNSLQRCDPATGRWAAEAECRTAEAPLGVCDAANGECDDCRPGDYSCNGNTLRSCNASGRWTVAGSACQGNTLRTCSGGALSQQTCAICDASNRECDDCSTPGAYSCAGATLQQCNATGRLFNVASNCSGNTLRTCPGNASGTSCTLCDEQNDQCDVCTPDDYGCQGETLRRCSADGQSWSNAPAACSGGVLRSCSGGVRSDVPCPAGETCNAAGTQCTECSPGQTVCFNSSQLRQCTASLAWGEPMPCEDGCRGEEPAAYCAECPPGEARCDPDDAAQPQTCGADGRWTDTAACAGTTPACDGGVCRCSPESCTDPLPFCLDGSCAACDPAMETATCNDGSVRTCSANGQWVDTPCPSGAPLCTGAGECVQCLSSDDCGGSTPFCLANECVACDPETELTCDDGALASCSASGEWQSVPCPDGQSCPEGSTRCVECVTDAECADTPSTPDCVANACVECETGETRCADGVRQTCDMQMHVWADDPCGSGQECVGGGECVSCTDDSDCQNPSPICDDAACRACVDSNECDEGVCAGGSCVECGTSADCTDPAAPICAGNACRGCMSDAECGGGGVCTGGGQCVECATSADCDNPTPVCMGNVCAACSANDQCSDGVCSNGECVDCASNADCDNPTPICASGLCGPCSSGPQCDTGLCAGGQCVECASSADCQNPEPACVDAACVPCTSAMQCPSGLCSDGSCVECASSADCNNPTPVCDDGACSACTGDAQCPNGALCSGGSCVQCETSAQCENPTPVCDDGACGPCLDDLECELGVCGATGECVQCETSTQCENPTPICADDNTCAACTADEECPTGTCVEGACLEAPAAP